MLFDVHISLTFIFLSLSFCVCGILIHKSNSLTKWLSLKEQYAPKLELEAYVLKSRVKLVGKRIFNMPSKLYSTTTWCSCKKETFFKAWNCIGVMQIPSHLSVSEVWLRWISSSSMFVRLRNPTLLKIKSSVFVCVKIKTIYTICMRQGYICDRVRNRKNHFETFLILKEELQEWEIQMKTKTHITFWEV